MCGDEFVEAQQEVATDVILCVGSCCILVPDVRITPLVPFSDPVFSQDVVETLLISVPFGEQWAEFEAYKRKGIPLDSKWKSIFLPEALHGHGDEEVGAEPIEVMVFGAQVKGISRDGAAETPSRQSTERHRSVHPQIPQQRGRGHSCTAWEWGPTDLIGRKKNRKCDTENIKVAQRARGHRREAASSLDHSEEH